MIKSFGDDLYVWCKNVHDWIWLEITDYKTLPISADFLKELFRLKMRELYL